MKPTIDAVGVRGEVTFPADEALFAETPKVPSEEVGVQTEESAEFKPNIMAQKMSMRLSRFSMIV